MRIYIFITLSTYPYIYLHLHLCRYMCSRACACACACVHTCNGARMSRCALLRCRRWDQIDETAKPTLKLALSIFFGIWPIFPILYALFRDAGFSCEATPAPPAAKGPACLSQRPRRHCLCAPGICSSDAGAARAANMAGSRCSAAGYFAASGHGYLLQGGVRCTDAAVCSHSTPLQDVPGGACRTLSPMDFVYRYILPDVSIRRSIYSSPRRPLGGPSGLAGVAPTSPARANFSSACNGPLFCF